MCRHRGRDANVYIAWVASGSANLYVSSSSTGKLSCPVRVITHQKAKVRVMKNVLAVVGLVVVLKKGYEFYKEYMELKRAQEERGPHREPSAYP